MVPSLVLKPPLSVRDVTGGMAAASSEPIVEDKEESEYRASYTGAAAVHWPRVQYSSCRHHRHGPGPFLNIC